MACSIDKGIICVKLIFKECIGSYCHTLLLACVLQINTMHSNCMNGCISNLHTKSLFALSIDRFFMVKIKGKKKIRSSDFSSAGNTSSKRRKNLHIIKEASFGLEEYYADDKGDGWFSESDG